MTTEIVPFRFNGAEVRTITIEGEPWFISTDVARILGAQSASGITRMIDDEDKGFHKVVTLGAANFACPSGVVRAAVGSVTS